MGIKPPHQLQEIRTRTRLNFACCTLQAKRCTLWGYAEKPSAQNPATGKPPEDTHEANKKPGSQLCDGRRGPGSRLDHRPIAGMRAGFQRPFREPCDGAKCVDLTGWKLPVTTVVITQAQEVPERPPGTAQPMPPAPGDGIGGAAAKLP